MLKNSFSKYKNKKNIFTGLLFLSILFCSGQALLAKESPNSLIEQLKEINANVIFMRHALAPGFGDPENFDLNNCETQRNLDDEGRQQAIDTGNYLRSEELKFDKIYSSQWCRCIETTKLLNFNIEEYFAGLNSFFQGHVSKKKTLDLLKKKLSQLDISTLTMMVTHQVVISAVTGIYISSGKMVAYNTDTGKAVLLDLKI